MSLWSWIKNKFYPSAPRTKSDKFEGIPVDLIMGLDFKLEDWTDPKDQSQWASIKILSGKYAGIRYKYNSLKLNHTSENDNFVLSMDYDFIEAKDWDIKVLGREVEFNNLVFNIAHVLIVTELTKDVEAHDYGNTGRNDSGELDRE
jgi:hypothetical protein